MTLVELLVAMLVLGVIGSVVTAGILSALESARHTNARVDALQELELGGQRIARELRASQSLVLAAGAGEGTNATPFETELGAEVRRDGNTYEINFEVIEGVDDEPSRLVSDTDGSEQTLITLVNLESDEPIFRYLDARGDELTCLGSCAATYAQAHRIEVVLRRNVAEGRPPVTVRTQVTIRNIRYPAVSP